MRFALLGLLALSACATAREAGPRRYEVRLERAIEAGLKRHVVIDASRTLEVFVDAGGQHQRGPATDLKVRLVAQESVVEVDARHRPLASDYAVESLVATSHAGTQELLHKGQLIKLQRGARAEQSRVTVDGAEASAEVIAALDVAIDLSASPGVADDKVFGSTEPRPVGASWPIRSDVAEADLLRAQGIRARISGQTTVEGTSMAGGKECLEVRVDMDGLILEMPNSPPGATFKEGRVNSSLKGSLPLDARLPPLAEEEEKSVTFALDVLPPGGVLPVQSSISVHNSRKASYSLE